MVSRQIYSFYGVKTLTFIYLFIHLFIHLFIQFIRSIYLFILF